MVSCFYDFCVITFLSKLLKWDKNLTGAMLLICAFGNTSFYGFPAVEALFGKDVLFYAIIYDQLGSFLSLSIIGTIIGSVYGSSSHVTYRMIIKKIITFPPFLALIIGMAFSSFQKPEAVNNILNGLAVTLVPVVTISVGSMLNFRQPSTNIIPLLITLGYKMILSPAIILCFMLLFGFSGMMMKVTVFEAAMPTMVIASVIASSSGLKPDLSNAAVGYGILLSFITFPILYWILNFF